MDKRTYLVLLFGGRSAEHDVSCISARHVAAAINRDQFKVIAVGITRSGDWLLADVGDPLGDQLVAEGPQISPAEVFAKPNSVLFPLIHGPLGEDGTLQGLLEIADKTYVGSGVLSSALCMDKAMTKLVCAHHGLPQCRYHTVSAHEDAAAAADRAIAKLGLPLFIKPANMGSSVGISRAANTQETTQAIQHAARYDQMLLIEEAVVGREIEVAILGNEQPQASGPGEVVPGETFYSYTDKYLSNKATLRIPAEIPQDVTTEVRRLALEAYKVLRCEGMARVDFFYEENKRGLLLNEVNTIPGFTPISMYPKLWQEAGMDYPQLIETLIDLAIERAQLRCQHRNLRL
ncbi:MAG: D-alanine--D-alanine ligase [Acidimicrobiia bacterium]|nr:D-alanine--D-alanine ligase [Acidimicrobiia bacterium]MYC57961.1 D-alanine--D-alanine ligase [Acidimicrobiia bacterium]MYG94649.1 D-alanine--D-alanine ligase [Acidimicrobiia bacterium]MYI31090.1 D-alanine--D-alanine ligase [Acidimicrobiia bacterium]